jgi:hypothetical protein
MLVGQLLLSIGFRAILISLFTKRITMKNSECTIYIMFKDKWLQKFRKEGAGWKVYSRNGTVRPCTAEQFISHILPPLAGIKGPFIGIKVEPDSKDQVQ